MFNNTSTVGPSQIATVIVTNYMGTLVLFLESVHGAKSLSMMKILKILLYFTLKKEKKRRRKRIFFVQQKKKKITIIIIIKR